MKIKLFSIAILSLALLFVACDQKKAQETKTPEENTEAPNSEPEATPGSDFEKPKPYQTVGFRKTACFGKCPVYEVKFYTNNKATWNGKMHVDRMGEYEADLEGKTIKSIRNKAHELGFFNMAHEYPTDHRIADLPSTITYIRIGDTEKSVKNTHDGPKELADFEAYIESIINKLEWKPAAKD